MSKVLNQILAVSLFSFLLFGLPSFSMAQTSSDSDTVKCQADPGGQPFETFYITISNSAEGLVAESTYALYYLYEKPLSFQVTETVNKTNHVFEADGFLLIVSNKKDRKGFSLAKATVKCRDGKTRSLEVMCR